MGATIANPTSAKDFNEAAEGSGWLLKGLATTAGVLLGTSIGMDPWTASGIGAAVFDYWHDGEFGALGAVGAGIAGVGIIDSVLDFGVESIPFLGLDGDSGLGSILTGPLSWAGGIAIGVLSYMALSGGDDEPQVTHKQNGPAPQ